MTAAGVEAGAVSGAAGGLEAGAVSGAGGGLRIASITPAPTDAERAAIAAAVEALGPEIWPDPAAATMPAPSPPWRYAGRGWRRRQSYGGWK